VNCGVHTKDAIHPGMHSSDICCSMAVSVFADTNPTEILNAGMKYSHMATCRACSTPANSMLGLESSYSRMRRQPSSAFTA